MPTPRTLPCLAAAVLAAAALAGCAAGSAGPPPVTPTPTATAAATPAPSPTPVPDPTAEQRYVGALCAAVDQFATDLDHLSDDLATVIRGTPTVTTDTMARWLAQFEEPFAALTARMEAAVPPPDLADWHAGVILRIHELGTSVMTGNLAGLQAFVADPLPDVSAEVIQRITLVAATVEGCQAVALRLPS